MGDGLFRASTRIRTRLSTTLSGNPRTRDSVVCAHLARSLLSFLRSSETKRQPPLHRKPMTTYISGKDLLELVSDRAPAVAVLDVRTPLERSKGHIAVSASLPFHEIEQRIVDLVPGTATTVVL